MRGWFCERVVMWEGGFVRGWLYERVVMWEGGYVRGWLYERVVIWEGGYMRGWLCEMVVMWEGGYMRGWLCERVVMWEGGYTYEKVVIWEGGFVRGWLYERVVMWEGGYVIWHPCMTRIYILFASKAAFVDSLLLHVQTLNILFLWTMFLYFIRPMDYDNIFDSHGLWLYWQPGGSIFVTTLNRTLISYGLGIIAAEQVFQIVPKGSHDWNKFVNPEALQSWLSEGKLLL